MIGRTSVWLLMYACLPWLLVATHRGLRDPRRWRWPAVVGLLVIVANGGANAALTFWILMAPPALLVYEVLVVRSARWRDAGALPSARRPAPWSRRCGGWCRSCSNRASAPTRSPFTEQPSGILATPSVSESFRLLGFWLAYFGSAAGPSVGAAHDYLFDPAVIVATFLVPLAAIGGFARTRRSSYAPFMLLLFAGGVLAMSLGFPPGSPMNRAFVALYDRSAIVQVLRTTWKATPLAALPLACLAALWTEAVIRQARTAAGLWIRQIRVPVWALAVLVPIPILWALPLFCRHRGRPLERVWIRSFLLARRGARRHRRHDLQPADHDPARRALRVVSLG